MTTERERIDFDVLFVGGGPACLAGAVRLMQIAGETGKELEVALIEKGAEIGAHSLSGAVMDPSALTELIPDHLEKGFPLETVVKKDAFYLLCETDAFQAPMVPPQMNNHGNYIVSQSRMVRWLAEIAEEMGVNVFPGFAGTEILYGPDGESVVGVRTGDKGLGHDGEPKANFEPGMDLMAKVVIFGEGARGSLMKQMEEKLGIADGRLPQVFETGIKEVIALPGESLSGRTGFHDIHTLGHPLGLFGTPGGGFIYEMADNRVAVGLLTALCYEDPMLDLYDAFMSFKRHPFVSGIIEGGKVVEQGARTVSTGGWYTMPKLAVNGAMFVGGAAAAHVGPSLKGIHVAMKSGMLAAEAAAEALEKDSFTASDFASYPDRFAQCEAGKQMFLGRNFAQALARKVPARFIHLGLQQITEGRGLFDPMHLNPDHIALMPATARAPEPEAEAGEKPAFDGELFVDKLTGVYLSKTLHREDQPSHVIVHDFDLCATRCWETYRSPCTRFCPGDVYEMETDEETGARRLKLNPSNCLHCKTCDVKDPFNNITWTCPEGGEGPGYTVV